MQNETNDRVVAYSPGSLSNLGPGFDCLGLAIGRPGDQVEVRWAASQGVTVEHIEGDGGLLPREADRNTAAVAAAAVLALAGVTDRGITLRLTKGLPLGSGLGSSGASAVAAAVAVNRLTGLDAPPEALLPACMQAEAIAAGAPHADNVAPSLLGGIVLVRPDVTPETIRLPTPVDLYCSLVHPDLVIHTRAARLVLPAVVPMADAVHQAAHLGALVSALYEGDLERLGRAVKDRIAEPARAPLIAPFARVVEAALGAGALCCSISGSGPTMFAFARGQERAEAVASAMAGAFAASGIACRSWATPVDPVGARVLDPKVAGASDPGQPT